MNIKIKQKKTKQTKSGNLNLPVETRTKTMLTGMECIQQQYPFSPSCYLQCQYHPLTNFSHYSHLTINLTQQGHHLHNQSPLCPLLLK